MKEQSLITVPNPLLSEVAKPVTSFDNVLKNQIETMRAFLKTHDGAGLAANQMGRDNRAIIVELEDKKTPISFQAFINPKIINLSTEKEILDEGCLSIPQIELPVERAKKIKIRFQNEEGKTKKLTAKDIFARILQHEIDHLNGIIFAQRVKEKFRAQNPNFKKLNIVFFGSGPFAATILEGLILLGLKINIVTEKAKPAGRHGKIKPTPVAEMTERFGKKYFEVEKGFIVSLRASAKQSSNQIDCHGLRPRNDNRTGASVIKDFRPDLLICADFGQKIPENILKRARIMAINIHPSLLPKHRGATPVQSAILRGEKTTGVTIIKMSPEIDQGDILAQIKTGVLPNDNTLTLTSRLSTLGLKLLFEALPLIAQKELKEQKQDESQATLTQKFQKSDGEIDWQKSPEQIERQIRAFYPWPGAYTQLPDNKRLLIHKGHLRGGRLVLELVQKEGKKPMKWQDFLRGLRGEKPGWFDKVK